MADRLAELEVRIEAIEATQERFAPFLRAVQKQDHQVEEAMSALQDAFSKLPFVVEIRKSSSDGSALLIAYGSDFSVQQEDDLYNLADTVLAEYERPNVEFHIIDLHGSTLNASE